MSTSDKEIVVGAYVTKKMVKTCCDDDGFITYVPSWTPVDNFAGVVSSIERFSDAFRENQILKLYERDKNYFEKDISINSVSVGTESPALSDSECLDLAKERGLEALVQVAHTLVCQFPFNAVIPLNSSILWMETLSSTGGPYHLMRSVDNLFAATPTSFALMNFNEPEFTYGAYEYVDDLNKSLTGKIVIAKPLESSSKISTLPQGFDVTLDSINVSRGSAGPDCAIDNSCYDPFAASVDVHKKVTWKNIDRLSHTITSGTPEDGPDGVFDSGLIPAIGYFSHTFYETGIYDYYCTFHPWMQGMVVVGEI
jgi:plastocyanin